MPSRKGGVMKKVILSLLFVALIASTGFCAKSISWNITAEANAPMLLPSTGIFKMVGAKQLYVTTDNTNATWEVLYYSSNGANVLAQSAVTANTLETLIGGYFKIRAVSAEAITGSAEVYLLN